MDVHGKTKSEKFLTQHNVVNHVSKFWAIWVGPGLKSWIHTYLKPCDGPQIPADEDLTLLTRLL